MELYNAKDTCNSHMTNKSDIRDLCCLADCDDWNWFICIESIAKSFLWLWLKRETRRTVCNNNNKNYSVCVFSRVTFNICPIKIILSYCRTDSIVKLIIYCSLKQSCRSLETLLIGLYNLEVVDKSGQQKAVSFRLPSLAMLSIYHEVRIKYLRMHIYSHLMNYFIKNIWVR